MGFLDFAFVEEYGYVLVFVAALLEAIPFLGLLVPGQLVVILAGVLASQGPLDLPRVILVAIAGGLLGQAIGYEAGRRVGRPLLDRFGPRFRITQLEVQRTEALFRKHGLLAVFVGHFSFLTRGLVNLMAGLSRYPGRFFWPVTIAAVVVWSAGYAALGFVFGEAYERATRVLSQATLVLGIALLLLAVGFVVARRNRRT